MLVESKTAPYQLTKLKLLDMGVPIQDTQWVMPYINDQFVKIDEIKGPGWLALARERFLTGFHEALHAVSVEGEGGTVLEESAKPNGNIKGVTRFFVSSVMSRIVIGMASSLGKEYFPHYHMSGCNHDLSVSQMLAAYYKWSRGSFLNVSQIMSDGLSRARSHASGYGFKNLLKRAWKITKQSI